MEAQQQTISRIIKFCSTDCRNEYREQAINGLAIPLADLKSLDELDDRCGCCFERIGGR